MPLHSELNGTDLHETKGADAALSGQILSADGLGASVWIDPPFLSTLTIASQLRNSYTSNLPLAALDTALTVPFDVTAGNPDVTIDSSGTITFATAGVYHVLLTLNMGRSATAGLAQMAARGVLGSTQLTRTYLFTSATDAVSDKTVTIPILRQFNASDVLKFQVIQDSAGGASVANTRGRSFVVTAAGWSAAAAADVVVSKLSGI